MKEANINQNDDVFDNLADYIPGHILTRFGLFIAMNGSPQMIQVVQPKVKRVDADLDGFYDLLLDRLRTEVHHTSSLDDNQILLTTLAGMPSHTWMH